MDKRRFRGPAGNADPKSDRKTDYPTLSEFEESRRSVLRRLGAAVLGLGSLGAILSACGDRSIHAEPDSGMQPPMGVAPMPDSGIDQRPRMPDSMGFAPQPDAQGDGKLLPDAHPSDGEPDWTMGGVPRMPDAEVEKPSDGGPKQD